MANLPKFGNKTSRIFHIKPDTIQLKSTSFTEMADSRFLR